MDIGFIGLGDMGRPMAGHLLANGFEVISCANRRRDAIEALKLEGLQEVDNPRLVAERADILMTIVVDQDQTEQVLRGDEGALTAMRPGSTIVVMVVIQKFGSAQSRLKNFLRAATVTSGTRLAMIIVHFVRSASTVSGYISIRSRKWLSSNFHASQTRLIFIWALPTCGPLRRYANHFR